MRRSVMTEPGWTTELITETGARPKVTPEGLVVEIEAAGVCHRDCLDRSGRFKFLNTPITPGHEAVGRVVEAGPQTSRFAVGDRVGTMHRNACGTCEPCKNAEPSLCVGSACVLGLLVDGTYATHISAPETAFFSVPNTLDAGEAAIMHCTFGTAYRGIRRALPGDRRGKRILVTGANGGVGAAAIQIAKRIDAQVIAVVRRSNAVEFVESLGADQVIVSDDGQFHKIIGQPVDAALDCVGEPTFNAALRVLTVGGTLVAIGNIVEARVQMNLGLIITKGLSILGSSGATPNDMAEVFALHARTPFSPLVSKILPLDAADEAQRLVQQGGIQGRLVLKP